MTEDMPGQAQASPATPLNLPGELAVLPLFNTVVYPGSVVPLAVSQPDSLWLVEEALRQRQPVALLALRAEDERPAEIRPADLYRIGTAGLVHKLLRLPDATLRVALQGIERVEVSELLAEGRYYRARARSLPDAAAEDVQALRQRAVELVGRMAPLIPQFPNELLEEILGEEEPTQFSYLVASCLQARLAERQLLLELPTARLRLEHLCEHLARTIRRLQLSRQLRSPRSAH